MAVDSDRVLQDDEFNQIIKGVERARAYCRRMHQSGEWTREKFLENEAKLEDFRRATVRAHVLTLPPHPVLQ